MLTNRKLPAAKAKLGAPLACADTNAAVDNIVEGLIERGIKVVRLGQPTRVRQGSACAAVSKLKQAAPSKGLV